MVRNLYARLAFGNLKKNRKIYLPYILTCIITVMMFYMIHSLSINDGIATMYGGRTIQYSLNYGTIIVGIFAVIFLFYTNSFVIKRRKKEFGIFNVLGMEKRHLGIVLIFETLYIALISIGIGLFLGILMDKLMYLIIANILQSNYGIGFFISCKSILMTLALFALIFIGIFFISFVRVKTSQPIELLKGENIGEKEPKTRHIIAIIGAVSLALGYICAVFTKNAIAAIELFFIAVILVILGTYFLFTAGSIALLKLLKKNKKFYYRTNHFTSVSGMIYRMKQNAVGLASICILFTMLLVTISTTLSFMVGGYNKGDEFMSVYGGMFFLGVYLGLLFLMGMILIIYYKQISEGYEDKKRFEIMQKVGMSYAEVKKSINTQILIVFFLPLLMAGIHIVFAFPMINLIMDIVGLTSTKLFALCSLGCFLFFSIIYIIVYLLTAKIYYRIVKAK